MADKEARLRLLLTAQNDAGSAFESVTASIKALTEPIENATKAATSLMDEFRSMNEVFNNASTSLEGTGRSISSVTQSSEALSKSILDDSKVLSEMTQTLSSIDTTLNTTAQSIRNIEEASQAFNKAKTNVNGLEESVSKAGLLIGLQQLGQSMESIGSKGDHLFKDAITSAAEFEASMSRIHAVLMNREPTADMKEMQETALKLGSNSKFSANEIATGMYDLARQGLSSTQILGDGMNGAIEVVNNLAQSVDGDMGDTAKVITDVMHEFGLSGDQLAKVGDIISGTMHTSSITMNDFYYSMRQVGPVASNMHQSIEDTSTAIALLAQHGISGSSAGTALKNTLLGLEPRTKKAAELMHDLGISAKDGAADSFYKLNGDLKPLPDIIGVLNQKFGGLNDKQKEAALAATFTKYGLAGLNTIVMEGKDKFEELKKTLSEEKAADIAKEKLNNLQGDMLRLNAATETMKKSFGDTLAPSLRTVAQEAQNLVTWFTNLDPSTKQIIMLVGGLASVMVTVGGAILSAVSAIGFLQMGLKGAELTLGGILTPIGLVTAAVIALGVGAYEVYTHWDEIKNILQVVWDKMLSFKNSALDVLTDSVNDHKTALIATASFLGVLFIPAIIKSGVEAVIAGGKLAAEFTVNVVKAGAEAVIAGAKLAASFTAEVIKMGVEVVVAAAKITGEMVVALLSYAMQGWVAAASTAGQTAAFIANTTALIAQKVALAASEIATGALTAAQWLLNVALDANPIGIVILAIAALGTAIYEVITHWQDIVTWVEKAWDELTKFKDKALEFGSDFVQSVANGITGAIHYVIDAATSVVNSIKSIFSSAPTAPSISPPISSNSGSDNNNSSGSDYSTGDGYSGFSDSVPAFGDGGVVTKPTLAMVGERGEREFIVPESKIKNQNDGYTLGIDSFLNGGAFRRQGTNGTVTIQNLTVHITGANKDGKQLSTDLVQGIRQQMSFVLQ
ncbi:phage tail tape measure protein [Paenibacillus filicis]|uniref:Phage tail tape measure protein n=1 Tax=Paenibacillus gyeongsangnamensis TaxID=3388067 RepID=A0ABT4Q6E4_9BACL|nr:phage tail tape measure protein [Paenibacillus filicis]MCZ8512401.1 phage tail tape measure protein [Paenibacillus filicis]